jgi:hypothetical protein
MCTDCFGRLERLRQSCPILEEFAFGDGWTGSGVSGFMVHGEGADG